MASLPERPAIFAPRIITDVRDVPTVSSDEQVMMFFVFS